MKMWNPVKGIKKLRRLKRWSWAGVGETWEGFFLTSYRRYHSLVMKQTSAYAAWSLGITFAAWVGWVFFRPEASVGTWHGAAQSVLIGALLPMSVWTWMSAKSGKTMWANKRSARRAAEELMNIETQENAMAVAEMATAMQRTLPNGTKTWMAAHAAMLVLEHHLIALAKASDNPKVSSSLLMEQIAQHRLEINAARAHDHETQAADLLTKTLAKSGDRKDD